jgi:predicted TIM-barrel fold metal-dependent hydrolase
MLLADYRPRPKLVTRETLITRPRYPVIDVHNHLGGDFGGGGDKRPISELLDDMDAVDVRVYVDLDGGWGEDILERHLDTIKALAPERFMVFGGVDWSRWPEHGSHFGEWAAGRLRAQVNRGAQGLKIWKPLGLSVRDDQGKLVHVDDERLDPIWQTASELHIPVLIHVADPVAFFDPIDGSNERWEELGGHPDWAFTSPPGPTFLSIVEGLAAVVARHPGTTFIGAHVGCYAENLAWVSTLLERCPNFYVDISARVAELGRQPFAARRFFLKHADRILFGLDAGVNQDFYRITFRFLESEDEYFPYGPGDLPGQGRWNIYGLHLPAKVLRQVYHANAMRVLGLAQLP